MSDRRHRAATYRILLHQNNTRGNFRPAFHPFAMPKSLAADGPARLVTSVEVARRKGCTGMAVRNAVKRGDLNAVKVGPVWVIADDAALDAWTVNETGGRTHRKRAGAAAAPSAEVPT